MFLETFPKDVVLAPMQTEAIGTMIYTVSKKNPTTNDNFNNSCPIPVTFGTNITE